MLCPKCGHAQADGSPECASCGVIFAKLRGVATDVTAAPDTTPADDVAFAEHARDAGESGPAWWSGAALLLVLGALWWLNSPSGGKIEQGHQIVDGKGFAYKPPKDWMALSNANFDQIMKPMRGKIPPGLRGFFDRKSFDTMYVRLPDKEGEFAPVFTVTAKPFKGAIPELTEAEKDKATAVLRQSFGGLSDDFKIERSEIRGIDGIKSLQVALALVIRIPASFAQAMTEQGTADSDAGALTAPPVGDAEIRLRASMTVTPGRHHGIVFTCMHSEEDPYGAEAVCRQTLESIRVTDRPPRFGGVTMGALNGGLIAAALGLMALMLRRTLSAARN